MHLNFHRGQWRAWNSRKRIILVLSGAQSGKTSFGPYWLSREVQEKGPGDYLVVAPTFRLLSLKLFPEFLRLFRTQCRWGDFTGRGSFQSRFLFNAHGARSLYGHVTSEDTQVFFGHAMDPDSIESATAKAAWLDEAGQKKFKLETWEAVQRRLSIHQGRVLITTTPYTLGWLRNLLFEPWRRCQRRLCSCKDKDEPDHSHPYIDVVQFRSIENPCFPREEYERTKAILPTWKHKMFYDGEFERPAGIIYEDFLTERHVCAPFSIPHSWPRYLGLDFGGVHTAGVFLAAELDANGNKTGKLYCYREYPKEGRWVSQTAKKHVEALLKGEVCEDPLGPAGATRRPKAYGGSHSEDQWREEFRVGGLFVNAPPIKDVEVGINRVTATLKQDQLRVFSSCTGLIDEFQNYSRELDDASNPTEDIEDKEDYHRLDALRYIISHLRGVQKEFWIR
jgi:hypothetical protein